MVIDTYLHRNRDINRVVDIETANIQENYIHINIYKRHAKDAMQNT